MGSTGIYYGLILLPALFYPALFFAYQRLLTQKRLQIESLLTRGKAMKSYAAAFRFANLDLTTTFRKMFYFNYSWRAYVFPICFNAITVSAAAAASLIRAGIPIGPADLRIMIVKVPVTVFAGLAGAYLWGVYDALRRYAVADLSAVSLYSNWLRMLVSAVLASIITMALKPEVALVTAFSIGVFPLNTISDFLQEKAKTTLNIGASAEPAEPPNLHKLQGLNASVIDNLAEAGIERVDHLAYADPIRLLLRTNINWKTILDIIDQSLLFGYVGDKLDELRPIGIRGSIELAVLGGDDADTDEKARQDADRIFTLVAAKLGQNDDGVKNLARNLYEDTQVNLIWDLWGDTDEDEDQHPQ